jgi:hypothetical protein
MRHKEDLGTPQRKTSPQGNSHEEFGRLEPCRRKIHYDETIYRGIDTLIPNQNPLLVYGKCCT